MPPPGNQLEALAERIVPIMQDFGLSGFVLIGYMETTDGPMRRVCVANTAKNPAFEDGLRPMIHAAHLWGAQPAVSGRPDENPPPPPAEDRQ